MMSVGKERISAAINAALVNGLYESGDFFGNAHCLAEEAMDAARTQGKFCFIIDGSTSRTFIEMLEYVTEADRQFKPWTFLVRDRRVVVIADDEQDAVYLRLCYPDS